MTLALQQERPYSFTMTTFEDPNGHWLELFEPKS